MNLKEVFNEYDMSMLKGNVNRMRVTDDLEELLNMYAHAKCRLDIIFYANYFRLKEEEKQKTEE